MPENVETKGQIKLFRLAGDSFAAKWAESFFAHYKDGFFIQTLTIGAGALNAAMKAFIITGTKAFESFQEDLFIHGEFRDTYIREKKMSSTAIFLEAVFLPHGLLQNLVQLTKQELEEVGKIVKAKLEARHGDE